ncbi:hypothetical protein B0H12DRAFT_1145882 [Mycena haematopus]|nr:hypothetical protein B0H12DRAFT_1145882 [Mycena haematopus]
MYFVVSVVAAFAGFSAAAATPVKRTITEPVAGTSISTGASIPFNYVDSNWCHEGYTPITIWLSDSAPTGLNATGQLPEGTYIEYFGYYLIGNYGLGPLPGYSVPPTNVTIPDISGYPSGSSLFLSVVETALAGTCPPGNGVPAQYAFSSVPLVVA